MSGTLESSSTVRIMTVRDTVRIRAPELLSPANKILNSLLTPRKEVTRHKQSAVTAATYSACR